MNVVIGVMIFEGALFLGAFVLLIVLIVQSIKEKKNETFEKRDN
jgi:hypothetical protein